MSRRPNTLDQFLDAGGSCTHDDTLIMSDEASMLGKRLVGQTGSSASVSAILGSKATISGLTGMTALSVGRCLTLVDPTAPGNVGTFKITDFLSASTVNVENTTAVVPDASNGSISWFEREPYTLEDDMNYRRTNERLIKGTLTWYEDIPEYQRPTDTLTDVPTNLSNIASKTLDAHAWLEPIFIEEVPVSTNDSFILISDPGNLQHASVTDITGVPIFDGYDAGEFITTYVHIVDADSDGYNDGNNILVKSGSNKGEVIFGVTNGGTSSSPNSVEIVFYSRPVHNWSMDQASLYSWEADQINTINIIYSYRRRLDRFDEAAIKLAYITRSTSLSADHGGLIGLGDNDHPQYLLRDDHSPLRELIHFIDDGPTLGFTSGAFKETLPSGSPFPTQIIWWESAAQLEKIVELNITRNAQQRPITEEWKMYDEDGTTVVETVVDSISYSGPFETTRSRTIS